MRILGIDPGATCGWCVYDDGHWGNEVWIPAPGSWIDAGAERWLGFPTVATLAHIMFDHQLTVAAIEEPFVRSGTGPAGWAVGETCKVFGYLRGRLEASDLRVVPVPAGDWQGALTGRPRGSKGMSKLVTAALAERGLLPKRSNQHMRDACGIAWFAAEQERKARAA